MLGPVFFIHEYPSIVDHQRIFSNLIVPCCFFSFFTTLPWLSALGLLSSLVSYVIFIAHEWIHVHESNVRYSYFIVSLVLSFIMLLLSDMDYSAVYLILILRMSAKLFLIIRKIYFHAHEVQPGWRLSPQRTFNTDTHPSARAKPTLCWHFAVK